MFDPRARQIEFIKVYLAAKIRSFSMPIQFQCPHCQHAMQLPDTAAGKQGKCPNCSNAVTVPAGSAAPSNPHDEEFWSELDEKKESAPAEVDGHAPVKRSDAQILKRMLGKVEEAKTVKRIGMPWERPKEGGMFDRYWDTAIGVMNHATDTFAEMKLTGGIGSPMKFLLLGALLGSLIGAVYGLVGNVIGIVGNPDLTSQVAEDAEGEDAESAPAPGGVVITVAMGIFMAVAFVATFVGGVIGGILHTFLQAAGLQVALPMVGVKEANFRTNFRVAAFTNGSIYLCNIVPGLGGAFMLFLWFNGMIKGLESVYKIPSKTAGLAVFLLFIPLVLPIVAVVGFFVLSMLGYLG